MQTTNYGINGTNINEMGQHLPPMQVYGKHEPFGHMGRTATRSLDFGRILGLADSFFRAYGRPPRTYYSPIPTNVTLHSFRLPGLSTFFLDIVHDGSAERVE